jgi:hypothetical protein
MAECCYDICLHDQVYINQWVVLFPSLHVNLVKRTHYNYTYLGLYSLSHSQLLNQLQNR